MKKCLLIAMCLVGFQGFSKSAIPGPSILFSISEKILAQAQAFMFPSFDKPVKTPKVKPIIKVKAKVPLKIDSGIQEKPVAPVTTSVKVKRDGMFITTE